jgi:DNA-binding winged helix-turn-helix (wHTH) protein/Tfp pilus assembly protein PilF
MQLPEYKFAGFRFDPENGLDYAGRRIHLAPKERHTLAVLLSCKGWVISKNDLIASVWPDEAVSDQSLSRCIYLLRQALRHPDGIEIIETLYGRGFRIAVEVRENAEFVATAGKLLKTPSVAAFETWQHARELIGRRTRIDMDMALQAFRQAAELDPGYLPAWSWQAECHIIQALRHYLPPREAGRLGLAAAGHALALDSNDTGARAAQAWIRGAIERQFDQALGELNHVVQLDPFYWLGRYYRAWILHASGCHEEAIGDLRSALELNPLAPAAHGLYASVLLCTQRTEAALSHLRRADESLPLEDMGLASLTVAASQLGHHNEAIKAGRRAAERSERTPIWLTYLAHALAQAGQVKEARALLREIETAPEAMRAPAALLAPVHLILGRREQALASLKRSAQENCPWFPISRYDPRLESLFKDTAFLGLMKEIPPLKKSGSLRGKKTSKSGKSYLLNQRSMANAAGRP